MKILLIGDFSKGFDEGLKNISKNINIQLSKKNDVKKINVKDIFSHDFYKIIKEFNPEVIHYFSSPTFSSLLILKILSYRWPKCKTVISALHPNFSRVLKSDLIRPVMKIFLKPDALLYQDNSSIFKKFCDTCYYLPNGVDLNKFTPVESNNYKMSLRNKYGIGENQFVVLHIGHLSEVRNLQVFCKINSPTDNISVLIVASTYVYNNENLLTDLKNANCKVIVGFVENIQELFQLSDCYVFPVIWGNTINLPLTILEAVATNLPVITLNYPGFLTLPFNRGLYLIESVDEIDEAIKNTRIDSERGLLPDNQKIIKQYSWENISTVLECIYQILQEG
jgi:glycosyltransferase involved in cell wall biosynthesis